MAKPDPDKVGTKKERMGEPVVQFTTLNQKTSLAI